MKSGHLRSHPTTAPANFILQYNYLPCTPEMITNQLLCQLSYPGMMEGIVYTRCPSEMKKLYCIKFLPEIAKGLVVEDAELDDLE